MKKLNCSSCSQPIDVAEDTVRATCSSCVARSFNPPPPPTPENPALPTPAIRSAVKDRCCNFISNLHQADRPCSVLSGSRCPLFEAAILPACDPHTVTEYSARYIGKGSGIPATQPNRCNDCHAAIPFRERYCDKCRTKRRRQTRKQDNSKRSLHVKPKENDS